MRIIIYSTAPWVKTGYGKNSAYLLRYLGEHHEMLQQATYGFDGLPLDFGDATIYANHSGNLIGSVNWLANLFQTTDADLIIQHFDSWVLYPNWISDNNLPVITYSPVDCDPLTERHKATITDAKAVVAMSKFAHKVYRKAGIASTYIPHGVDTKLYMPMDKVEARKRFGVPSDAFVFGCIATNLSHRKNIPNQLFAFKKLLEKHPEYRDNTLFYLHTYLNRDSTNPMGYDLPAIVKGLGLRRHIVFTEPNKYLRGFPEEDLVKMMNCFDVHSLCSFGEGFGLPIIECGACGVPSIVTNFSSSPEVVGEGGITVEPDADLCWWTLDSWQKMVGADKIFKAYEKVRGNPDFLAELSEKALENARQYDYEEVVIPMWLNLLEELS